MLDSPGFLPNRCLVERIYAQVAIALAEGTFGGDERRSVEPGTPTRPQHHLLIELVELSVLIVDILASKVCQPIVRTRHRHHA